MKKIMTLIFTIMIMLLTIAFVSADIVTVPVLNTSSDISEEMADVVFLIDRSASTDVVLDVIDMNIQLQYANLEGFAKLSIYDHDEVRELNQNQINVVVEGEYMVVVIPNDDVQSFEIAQNITDYAIDVLEYSAFTIYEYRSAEIYSDIEDMIEESREVVPLDIVFVIDDVATQDVLFDAANIAEFLEQEGYDLNDLQKVNYKSYSFRNAVELAVYIVMDEEYVMTVIPEDSIFAEDVADEVSEFVDDELRYDEDTIDFDEAEDYDTIREMLDDNKDDAPEATQQHWAYTWPNEYTSEYDSNGNIEGLVIEGVSRGQEITVRVSVGGFPLNWNESSDIKVKFDNDKLDYSCSNGIELDEDRIDLYSHDWHEEGAHTRMHLYFQVDEYFDYANCDLDIELVYEDERYAFELDLEFDGTEPAFVVAEKEFEEGWNLVTISEAIQYDYLSEEMIKAAYLYDAQDRRYYDIFEDDGEMLEEISEDNGLAVIWMYISEDYEVKTTVNKYVLQEIVESYGNERHLEFEEGWNFFALMPHMSEYNENGFLDIGYDVKAINRYDTLFFWDVDDQEWEQQDWKEIVQDDDILSYPESILYPYLTYYNFDYNAEFQGWTEVPEFPDMPYASSIGGSSGSGSEEIVIEEPVVEE